MKLATKLIDITEGGLVKIPKGLQSKVGEELKAIMMGQVLYVVDLNITQFSNILNNIEKDNA